MIDASGDLPALIHQLESRIDANASAWPDELFRFVSRITPLVNVDLLIRDEGGRTLLTWRSDQYYGPGWHVPGGIIRFQETAADRIRIVAKRELGVAVEFDASPVFVHESIVPGRRDRGHAISLLYRCRLVNDLDQGRQYTRESLPLPDQWLWHDRCPENLLREQQAYAVFMG